MPPLLEARALTKRFPGVVALKDINFDLRPFPAQWDPKLGIHVT